MRVVEKKVFCCNEIGWVASKNGKLINKELIWI